MILKGDDEFTLKVGSRTAARLQYIHASTVGMKENMYIISHTVVFESFKGKGYGRQLIEALVEFAREKGATIEPQCPFAKDLFARTPEIQDVLAR